MICSVVFYLARRGGICAGRSVLEYWHESAGMGVDNDITFFHAGVDLEQGYCRYSNLKRQIK